LGEVPSECEAEGAFRRMTSKLRVTILGSGSSGGVPRLGGPDAAGDWGTCDPGNPKNRRRRCSILVRRGETAVLVDTSPDLREQLLSARAGRLDAVLLTHSHADQTHGIDDLRPFALTQRRPVNLYGDEETLDLIIGRFGYCFSQPEGSVYKPIVTAHVIADPFKPFEIAGEGGSIPVRPFWQEHGGTRSLGFRFGKIAYSSDVKELDEDAFAVLEGIECWIVDALQHKPHPTHANVETALKWIARLRPKRAILTNLHTSLDYETLKHELPPGVEPAYDGLEITAQL
jgi:phosphoribosyl 1,2-cyclic phosphate phosphodiesterase